MKTLTFAFDVSITDQLYAPKGTKVQVDENVKQLTDHSAVYVREVKMEENDETVKYAMFRPVYFSNECFMEFQ